MNETAVPFFPPEPKSLDETGLGLGFLSDLVIKVLYFQGYITGAEIADRVRLPFSGIVDRMLEFLKREKLCEIKGTGGGFGQGYVYFACRRAGVHSALCNRC